MRRRIYGANKRERSKALSLLSMPAKRARYSRRRQTKKRGSERAVSRFGTQYNLSTNRANRVEKPLFGAQYTTRLIYFERGFSINPGIAGIPGAYVFSANGLYDPDISGVGHQPSGFDQMMAFWDHYTVKSAKIYVDFANADTMFYNHAGIYVADGAVAPTDIREVIENGKGIYTLLGPAGRDSSSTSLCLPVSISNFLGRPDVLDEDSLRGTNASNPSEQVYFIVWAAPNSGVDSSAVGLSVRIEYYATFTEAKDFTIS